MKNFIKVFGFVFITGLAGFMFLSAAENNNHPQTINIQKPVPVLVKAAAHYDEIKKTLGAYARLKYNNAPLKGWKVNLNNMNMSYAGDGLYKLARTGFSVTPGKRIIITMTPPRPNLIVRRSKPLRPTLKFMTIRAKGTIGQHIYITFPQKQCHNKTLCPETRIFESSLEYKPDY